ncbi:PLC-like phosphodiesterase, partial [Dimargaris cristalligena]
LCMGHALLCDRPYNQITLAATHVSHAVRKNEKAIGTQDKDIPTQLKDGIRGFFLEVHPSPTEAASAQLCFISCTVNDGGTLGQTLQVLANFLANNPRELVTIVLDNPGGVETAAITKDFVAAGLDTLSATGPALGDWQTAGQLLDAGKQAVIIAQANVKAPPAW